METEKYIQKPVILRVPNYSLVEGQQPPMTTSTLQNHIHKIMQKGANQTNCPFSVDKWSQKKSCGQGMNVPLIGSNISDSSLGSSSTANTTNQMVWIITWRVRNALQQNHPQTYCAPYTPQSSGNSVPTLRVRYCCCNDKQQNIWGPLLKNKFVGTWTCYHSQQLWL